MDATSHSKNTALVGLLDELAAPSFKGTLSHAWFETNALASSRVFAQVVPSAWERSRYLDRLLSRQLPDGSWQEDARHQYLPDAMVSTSSALLALLTNHRVTPESRTVQKGLAFLAQNLPVVLKMDDEKKPIGFEAILVDHLNRLAGFVPALAIDAQMLAGITHQIRARLAPKLGHLHQTRITLHSVLDAFTGQTEGIDWQALAALQEADGSMGIYASSTLALLEHLEPTSPAYQKGLGYLQAAVDLPLALPPFYPSNAFEIWWALYHLGDSPLKGIVALALRQAGHLLAPVPAQGIAVTENFSLPDVDTTAMKLAALLFLEQEAAIDSLESFWMQGVFRCYQYENRVSPSANVHALMAIVLKAERDGRLLEAQRAWIVAGLEYLLAELQDKDHLVDKWHLSDLYATCHATELFIHIAESFIVEKLPRRMRHRMYAKTLEMLQYTLTQRCPDGGWGDAVVSTVEETGYAVRALAKAHLAGIIDIRPLLETASAYLLTHRPADDIPLWIGKSLYKSFSITQALQSSALAWLEHIEQRRGSHAYSASDHAFARYSGGAGNR